MYTFNGINYIQQNAYHFKVTLQIIFFNTKYSQSLKQAQFIPCTASEP